MWLLAIAFACSGPDGSDVQTTEPTDSLAPYVPGDPLLRFDGERPKNVVMLSVDTTRRDHVDRYATDGVVRMPELTQWLEGGVTLDDHQQCSSWTYGSTVCTLGGTDNELNGFMPKLGLQYQAEVPDGQRTLATLLRDAGWSTYLVTSNAWMSADWNNAQGYDTTLPPMGGTAVSLVRTAFDMVVLAQGSPPVADPWLVHVHLIEPHVPYSPPAEYLEGYEDLPPLPDGWDLTNQAAHYYVTDQWPTLTPDEQDLLVQHLRFRYDADLAYMDKLLGDIFDNLAIEGWLEDTLVVVWTDHGEQFFEHNHQTHAWGLAAEENDAVLSFHAQNLEPASWSEPTHAIDMVPTVLQALGQEVPDDLMGHVVGTADPTRARFGSVSARQGTVQSVTQGQWKLQYNWNGNLRLWDRGDSDRQELVDVYDPNHPAVAELWDLLEPRVEAAVPLVGEREPVWPDL